MAAQLNIKLFSENTDMSLVEIALRQIVVDDLKINFSSPKIFEIKSNDVVILGISSLEDNLLTNLLDASHSSDNQFIIVTESQDILLAATLARFGFNEIYVFPQELQKFKTSLSEIVENFLIKFKSELSREEEEFQFENIIGHSPQLMKVISTAKKVAANKDVSLLILGETGTGKGLLAHTIHKNSPNHASPFVDIVCSAIPVTLLESELFGYEKGAFTDARNRKLGLFELAENGSIFLDEIGDLTPPLQVKLLRAIDNKVIRRLGGTRDIKLKSRIIAATNLDLEKLVEQNLFRADLYHRLNVISINIPPLREREEDVLDLAKHFINEIAEKFNKPKPKIGAELRQFLLSYSWPGNIRELRNSLERGVLLTESTELIPSDLFPNLGEKEFIDIGADTSRLEIKVDYSEMELDSISKIYAKEVLQKCKGNKSKTAKILGISRPKLDKLLK